MRLKEIWRTSTFRLSLLYGVLFALATVALLGMVYLRSAVYLTRRVDDILNVEAQAQAQMDASPAALQRRINDALAMSGGHSVFAAFSANGVYLAGNLRKLPPGLKPGGAPIEMPPTADYPALSRLIARRLPSGEIFVVGRDINQLSEMRRIIGSALVWSGSLILLMGIAGATALSLGPIRRLQRMQTIGHDIAAGNLTRRMPVTAQGDELDMFADIVNHMIGEVERLMSETKASTDIIAHDLRTPLTRARAQLHRIAEAEVADRTDVRGVTQELDEVLERFRAILRISEIEARARRGAFAPIDLGAVVREAAELYRPLADEVGVELVADVRGGCVAEADAKLLFEAISNLVDNAIKFTPRGGRVDLALKTDGGRFRILVQDNGPGVPAEERSSVLQRFYRRDRDRLTPGSGLGLSIVAAIARLHQFELALQDGEPGLRVVLSGRASGPSI
jgi:signal transduction histidine kinase